MTNEQPHCNTTINNNSQPAESDGREMRTFDIHSMVNRKENKQIIIIVIPFSDSQLQQSEKRKVL